MFQRTKQYPWSRGCAIAQQQEVSAPYHSSSTSPNRSAAVAVLAKDGEGIVRGALCLAQVRAGPVPALPSMVGSELRLPLALTFLQLLCAFFILFPRHPEKWV